LHARFLGLARAVRFALDQGAGLRRVPCSQKHRPAFSACGEIDIRVMTAAG
jgi:hypothetical protein